MVITKKNIFVYFAKNWIAILALGISAWLFYKDYLQPFRLDVRSVGRITISKNPFSEELRQDSILLDLIFANQGAKRGVVEDVVLAINTDDWNGIYRSLAEQKDRSLNLQKDLVPPKLETFIGFELVKYDSMVRRILFVPYSEDGELKLSVGTYFADLWVRSSESTQWVKKNSIKFTIEPKDVETIKKSQINLQPEGGYFVKWFTVDKILDQSNKRIKELIEIISNKNLNLKNN